MLSISRSLHFQTEDTFECVSCIDGVSTNFIFKHKAKDCRVGDRFALRFNFENHECCGFYNDQKIGVLTEDLPERICPALSSATKHAFETTKWEVFAK